MFVVWFSGSINSDVKADGSHNRHNVVNKPRVVGVGDFKNLLKLKMFKYILSRNVNLLDKRCLYYWILTVFIYCSLFTIDRINKRASK